MIARFAPEDQDLVAAVLSAHLPDDLEGDDPEERAEDLHNLAGMVLRALAPRLEACAYRAAEADLRTSFGPHVDIRVRRDGVSIEALSSVHASSLREAVERLKRAI